MRRFAVGLDAAACMVGIAALAGVVGVVLANAQEKARGGAQTVPGEGRTDPRAFQWSEEAGLTDAEYGLKRAIEAHELTPDFYVSFFTGGGAWEPRMVVRDPETLLRVEPARVNYDYRGKLWSSDWALVERPPPGVKLTERGEAVYRTLTTKLKGYHEAARREARARREAEAHKLRAQARGLFQ